MLLLAQNTPAALQCHSSSTWPPSAACPCKARCRPTHCSRLGSLPHPFCTGSVPPRPRRPLALALLPMGGWVVKPQCLPAFLPACLTLPHPATPCLGCWQSGRDALLLHGIQDMYSTMACTVKPGACMYTPAQSCTARPLGSMRGARRPRSWPLQYACGGSAVDTISPSQLRAPPAVSTRRLPSSTISGNLGWGRRNEVRAGCSVSSPPRHPFLPLSLANWWEQT